MINVINKKNVSFRSSLDFDTSHQNNFSKDTNSYIYFLSKNYNFNNVDIVERNSDII